MKQTLVVSGMNTGINERDEEVFLVQFEPVLLSKEEYETLLARAKNHAIEVTFYE